MWDILIALFCIAAVMALIYLFDDDIGCTGDCNQGRKPCNCPRSNRLQ